MCDVLSDNLSYLGPPLYSYAALRVQAIITWDTLIAFQLISSPVTSSHLYYIFSLPFSTLPPEISTCGPCT